MLKNVLDTDLSGKVAVVTGAGGVLCSDMAKVLARAGAKVALLNRTVSKAQVYADEITAGGGAAKAYPCNVVDAASCQAAAAAVLADFGPCDILVNGAGGNNPKATTDKEYYEPGDREDKAVRSFFDLSPEAVTGVFDLNFLGTILPTQAFVPQMLGRSGCCILNISSMNAYTPLTKIPAYSGAKAAVTNLTQWLAVHFSRQGIRVNAIAPGFFAAGQNQQLLYNPDGTPTARTGKILAATPHGPLRRQPRAGRRAAVPRQRCRRQLYHRRHFAGGRRFLGLFRRIKPCGTLFFIPHAWLAPGAGAFFAPKQKPSGKVYFSGRDVWTSVM